MKKIINFYKNWLFTLYLIHVLILEKNHEYTRKLSLFTLPTYYLSSDLF